VAALAGGRLVVHFTNRKNAPFLFSTRIGTPPGSAPSPHLNLRILSCVGPYVPLLADGRLQIVTNRHALAVRVARAALMREIAL
jgi:hypothetical protein